MSVSQQVCPRELCGRIVGQSAIEDGYGPPVPNAADTDTDERLEARRTQQQRRTVARAALLSAAAELVVESGIRSVTFARVGERAGYSRGMVTHHFGSKRGLLDALARDAQAGLSPGLEDEAPGLDRLLRLVEAYVRNLETAPVAWRSFLVLWADAVSGGELAPVMRERDAWFRGQLRADVAAGQTDGSIRQDVDPDTVAIRVVAELRGIGMQRILDPAPPAAGLAAAVTYAWNEHLATHPTRSHSRDGDA